MTAARRLGLRWLIGCLALFAFGPLPAAAHPLDEYLQAAYLVLAPDGVVLELVLTPGLLVAPEVITLIDADRDGWISDLEAGAYGRTVLNEVALDVDQQRRPLEIISVDMPSMLTLESGVGEIRLKAITPGPPLSPGAHRVLVANQHAPVKSAFQATAVIEDVTRIAVNRQERNETERSLLVAFTVAPAAGTDDARPVVRPADLSTDGRSRLIATLAEPSLSPWLLLVSAVLSAALGGAHALTPGHGKTLLAAYLVGSRGTARHAVALGGIVTFTHTASVIVVGLIALAASRLIVPNLLVPALEIASGALVLALGFRLIRARWPAVRDHRAADHPHDHPHDHHGHEPALPTDRVGWSDLLTMGASGGIVPCPEALGVLLVAVGLNRIALGLGLIVAYSVGLALVLCLIGILLVHSRRLVDRLGLVGHRAQGALTLGSAVVVTVLGAGILAKGALAYLS